MTKTEPVLFVSGYFVEIILIDISRFLGFVSFKSTAGELSQKTLDFCGLKKSEVLEVGEKTMFDA